YSAVENRVVGAEIDLQVRKSRLLQVELRFVRVVGVLRGRLDAELDRGRDRLIVADETMAEEDLLEDLFAVQRVFESKAHVDVIERRRVAEHREDVVAVTRRLRDLD